MPVARARAVVVDHIPGDRACAHLERDGEALLLLAADRPLTEIAEQLTDRMQDDIDARVWTQHWDNSGEPPQRVAS